MKESNLKSRNKEIESLALKVQKGDQDAFAKLYDILIDPVYRYVFYRVKDEEAEDLVETVFIKVWENIKQYKPGKNAFSAWVFRIAHNLVVDYYRMGKDQDFVELDVRLPDYKREHNPIRIAEDSLNQSTLKSALSKLKGRYRDIIIHKFLNELSNEELAEIMGKSEGSLRILQFRALKALKKELEEMGEKG